MAGFIHNKLDIKLLALYLASKLIGPVEFPTFIDLALCDDGVDYFQFSAAARELVETGHLSNDDELCAITEKGLRNIAEGGDSLSPVIRKRVDKRVVPVNEELRRRAQFRSSVEPAPGGFAVRLSFHENEDELLSLSLWTPDEDSANMAAQRFQSDPKRVYEGVLELLLDIRPETDHNKVI